MFLSVIALLCEHVHVYDGKFRLCINYYVLKKFDFIQLLTSSDMQFFHQLFDYLLLYSEETSGYILNTSNIYLSISTYIYIFLPVFFHYWIHISFWYTTVGFSIQEVWFLHLCSLYFLTRIFIHKCS